MSDDLERKLADGLADGKLTDGDAEAVREFADFLKHAGPPAIKGQPSPDGKNMAERLAEAGRFDLIDYAIPGTPIAEQGWWDSLDDESAFLNTAGDPPYDVSDVTRIILEGRTARRVLDLGCGMGRLTNHVARLLDDPHHVHGVDVSTAMIHRAFADKPSNATYWHCDGRNLPAGLTGTFDLAYSVAVLQHIPETAVWRYIAQVEERLRPGGAFVFTLAIGDVDEFLNHQVDDPHVFANDLIQISDSFRDVRVSAPDARGWTWIAATKES